MQSTSLRNRDRAVTRILISPNIHGMHGFVDEQMDMIELLGGESDLYETQREMEALAFWTPRDACARVADQTFNMTGG